MVYRASGPAKIFAQECRVSEVGSKGSGQSSQDLAVQRNGSEKNEHECHSGASSRKSEQIVGGAVPQIFSNLIAKQVFFFWLK